MPSSRDDEDIMILEEVADASKVLPLTIGRPAKDKQRPGLKVGGSSRISMAGIDEGIKRQSSVGLRAV
ncbi:MAG: hypothetical protein RIQ97_1753 [Pseudomonadota bacterium]|jgi:hypothetical protein